MASGEDSGQQKKLIIAVVLFAAAGLVGYFAYGGNDLARKSHNRDFVCAKTGEAYDYTIKEGDYEPYYSPLSGANTGYLAEKCYWMKDANGEYVAKSEPTVVLLKSKFEPGATTYCPDCGKEVVGHNPMPKEELMKAAKAAGR